MAELTLRVSGMTCMGCVNSVKRLLTALPGVVAVEVDLPTGMTKVTCDPARVTLDQLTQAIQEGGYQVVS